MAEPSRLDRYVKMLGGEENLPPQQASAQDQAAAADQEATSQPPQQNDNVHSSTKEAPTSTDGDTNAWWNAKPELPPLPQQPPAAPLPQAGNTQDSTHDMPAARRGDTAPLGIKFTPFGAITKFPYKFVKKDMMQPMATAFFDSSKIYHRQWDLYYVWSEQYPTTKPVIFVPEYQLLALINEINDHFPNAKIRISDELREDGLVIDFDDIPQPALRPRFLGQSSTREQVEAWSGTIVPDRSSAHMPEASLAAFRAKLELAQEIAKNKTKAARKQRQEQTILKLQGMARMMARVQQYLGLQGAPGTKDGLPNLSSLSLGPVMVDHVAPYAFNKDVIFIAVDVEAWELPPRPVTEIGIATLDTRDLKGKAPGPNGSEWQKAIRAVHIRVVEYMHYRNNQYVSGCPDKFEFGESTLVGMDKLTQTIAACFRQPYSGPAPPEYSMDEKRKIVLVGHDISQDINYLRQTGYNVMNCSNLHDHADTAEMFRVYTKDPNARSLASLLDHFDMTGWHLHNAGNDAVYTLWALLAMAVAEATEKGTEEGKEKEEVRREVRTEAAVEVAKERAEEEMDGWDGEGGGEGGVEVAGREEKVEKPMFGPKRPGEEPLQYYTPGGALLDV